MSIVLDLIILATGWTHVVLAPYTKVEESFNLHVVHDVIMYGIRPNTLDNYDHFIFPGAVPRTFIGSVLLGWLSTPAIHFAHAAGFVSTKADLQIIVRLVLSTVNAIMLCLLRRGVSRRFGGPASVLFVLLTCTQFHLPFWMGRTLANMYALFIVNLALYFLINRVPNSTRPTQQSAGRAIALLMFATTVFRAELFLLLVPLVLQALIRRYLTLSHLLKTLMVYGLGSVALTMAVDSYFWRQSWLWPEGYSASFNVIQGKSAEWGVLPYHTYFSSFLPKLLLSSVPLSAVGVLTDSRIRALLIPSLAFITLISKLGHKEWRFVVYVVPVFNIAAARGAAWLTSRRKGSLFGRISFMAVAGLLGCNCIATYLLTVASIANYPGGTALTKFNKLYASQDHVHVHISNLAAQTGASLFQQTHAPPYPADLDIVPSTNHWTYDKTENLSPRALTAAQEITHLIAESGTMSADSIWSSWKTVDTVDGFDRWAFNPGLHNIVKSGLMENLDVVVHPLEMIKSDKLVILERSA